MKGVIFVLLQFCLLCVLAFPRQDDSESTDDVWRNWFGPVDASPPGNGSGPPQMGPPPPGNSFGPPPMGPPHGNGSFPGGWPPPPPGFPGNGTGPWGWPPPPPPGGNGSFHGDWPPSPPFGNGSHPWGWPPHGHPPGNDSDWPPPPPFGNGSFPGGWPPPPFGNGSFPGGFPPMPPPMHGGSHIGNEWITNASHITAANKANAVSGVCKPTVTTTEGPYYKSDSPSRNDASICQFQNMTNGTQVLVQGKVYSGKCKASIPALLDVWQANPQGEYSPKRGPDYMCRGRVQSDSNGNYKFFTTVPGHYADRAAHIHLKINPLSQPSNILTTQLYFQGDPVIQTDHCDFCGVGDPTTTFPLQVQTDKSYMITFNIVLS